MIPLEESRVFIEACMLLELEIITDLDSTSLYSVFLLLRDFTPISCLVSR